MNTLTYQTNWNPVFNLVMEIKHRYTDTFGTIHYQQTEEKTNGGKNMLGVIIGDIVGSRFEFGDYKSKEFELFTKECCFTDDTVLTIAVANALMITLSDAKKDENDLYVELSKNACEQIRSLGIKYKKCGYGGMFTDWLENPEAKPYNSYGNGAAMRVGAAGFAARSEQEAIAFSNAVTEITHNHPEGIKGAEAVALGVFLLRKGCSKQELRHVIEENYYPLNFTLDDIRPDFDFDETCQGTVPPAIEAFLESNSFEDAIRNAISLSGDSDTIAAITGALAQAHYGVPTQLAEIAWGYLDDTLKCHCKEWDRFLKNRE